MGGPWSIDGFMCLMFLSILNKSRRNSHFMKGVKFCLRFIRLSTAVPENSLPVEKPDISTVTTSQPPCSRKETVDEDRTRRGHCHHRGLQHRNMSKSARPNERARGPTKGRKGGGSNLDPQEAHSAMSLRHIAEPETRRQSKAEHTRRREVLT